MKGKPMARFTRSKRHFTQALAKRGFEYLGGGMYSDVYAKPGSDYVVKVGSPDGWPEFVRWCSARQGQRFIPEIRSFKWHDEFYVAVMQRLSCSISQAQCEESWEDYEFIGWLSYCDGGEGIDYVNESLNNWVSDGYEELGQLMLDLGYSYPSAFFDTHGGNWMYDANGRLFLTDPFSSHPKGRGSAQDKTFRIKSTRVHSMRMAA